MFSKEEFELFQKYCQINAVSSFENNVAKVLKNDYKKLGYSLIYDNFGNLFAYKKSKNENSYKVLIDAHMDEVGFIVRQILENGLIKAMLIGGISYEAITSQRFLLTNCLNKCFVGAVDINSLPSSKKVIDVNFDFGFQNKEDAKNKQVKIGDMISFIGPTILIDDKKKMMSKAIDNRYGIVLGLEVLKHFQNVDLPYDLYVGGSINEEVGLRGAKVVANNIKPDLVIVLDCSNANKNSGNDGKIGDGVLIRYFDHAMIARPSLLEKQIEACKKADVKYQYFRALGGTNAGVYHIANEGIKTLTHCICGNNIHTANTIIDSDDYHSAKLSLFKLLENLNLNDFQ